jgi:hypothetical protein
MVVGVGFGMSGASSQADISQLRFTVTGQSGSSAMVRASGTISVNGTAMPYDLTLPMLNEDNRWKLCG